MLIHCVAICLAIVYTAQSKHPLNQKLAHRLVVTTVLKMFTTIFRVPTLLLTKKSRTFPKLSRTTMDFSGPATFKKKNPGLFGRRGNPKFWLLCTFLFLSLEPRQNKQTEQDLDCSQPGWSQNSDSCLHHPVASIPTNLESK